MRALVVSVITLLVTACGPTPPPRGQIVALPSGKQVRLLGVGQMPFPNGASALVLSYETEVPLDDIPTLEKEVEEIWARFEGDVERAKLTNAIVSANEKPRGFIVNLARNLNFPFERNDEGRWSPTWKQESSTAPPQ